MGVSVGTRVRIGRCDKAHVPCPLLTAVPLLARPFRPHPYPLVHRYVFAVFTDAGSWHSPATPQLDCSLFQIPQKSSLPWVASRAGVLAFLALPEWRSAENLGSSCPQIACDRRGLARQHAPPECSNSDGPALCCCVR